MVSLGAHGINTRGYITTTSNRNQTYIRIHEYMYGVPSKRTRSRITPAVSELS